MMAKAFIAIVLAAVMLINLVSAADCNTKSNHTSPANLNPVDLSAPVFVRSVPNGELYTVGGAENQIHLMHLYGYNGYDFGYAAGQLMPVEMHNLIHTAWSYFKEQIMKAVNGTANKYHIPAKLIQDIADKGLEMILDLQNDESEKYISSQIYAELHGIADASGVDYKMIRRIHFIGEVTRGSCSLYGAWGKATYQGKTLQLRALDWDTGAGLQNYPTVTIYHPMVPELGTPFANVGWAGWIGTLTGMGANKLGISEIGVSYPDNTFGDESYIGIPFIFLERKIIQHGTSVFNAMDIITNATRTCHLILGIGDGNAKTAREVQYSHSKVRFFNDTDLEPHTWWHPRIPEMVYNGMDWICPYYQHLLYLQLTKLHGQLTPENTIMNVTAVVGTGDLHIGIYDLTENHLFVANARGQNQTGPAPAYQRQFIKLDLNTHYNKKFGERF